MTSESNGLREFGRFRLDLGKKTLWHDGESVPMPLKEIEILCVLVENRGELVTKDQLLETVWADSFVEESNLSRHIYLLRKAIKELGGANDLIQNVPRRGYRFVGDVREVGYGDIVIERRSQTRTVIQFDDGFEERARPRPGAAGALALKRRLFVFAGVLLPVIIAGSYFFWNYQYEGPPSAATRSIAVLPLKSFSPDSGDEELRMRITDALITRLGSFGRIAVRPTSAVLSFANPGQDALEAGRKLQVDAVLDGRVQQEGDRLRVTVQLIRTSTGEHLWSEQFDGNAGQILDLQDRISARVSHSISTESGDRPALAKRLTDSPEAYDAYLKGRYFWGKRDEVSLRKAIEYFEQAAAIDPGFSEAYAGIADAQQLLFNYNIEITPEIIALAKENLARALSLKPDSADALTTLGTIQMGVDWDWKSAEESLKRAISAAPNSSIAHMRYGALLIRIRRFDEAQNEFERSLELDPLSILGSTNLGLVYFCKRDFAAADRQFRKMIELDETIASTHWLLSRSLWQAGRKGEAVSEVVRALELDRNQELAKIIRKKSQGSPEDGIRALLYAWRDNPSNTNPHNLAYLSTYVGDTDRAIHWLERSVEEHHPWTTWVSAAPEFAVLAGEPRYQHILRQMNLSY